MIAVVTVRRLARVVVRRRLKNLNMFRFAVCILMLSLLALVVMLMVSILCVLSKLLRVGLRSRYRKMLGHSFWILVMLMVMVL